MGDLPKILNEKWKEQHKKRSEEEFKRVAAEGQSAGGPSFFKTAEVTAAGEKEEKAVMQ